MNSAQGSVHRTASNCDSPRTNCQVLRQEQKAAEQEEDAESVGGERRAECAHPKESQIDQRVGQAQLSVHERQANGKPGKHRKQCHDGRTILRDLLQSKDHCQHRSQ
jgi:hypothetical protein